ncbi:MAG TPA: alpha/beta hydrolase [Candidatus Acidoferrales bacterium]
MRFHYKLALAGIVALCCSFGASAASTANPADKKAPAVRSGFVTAPDGVKIHYFESGKGVKASSAEVGNPLPSGTKATKGNISVYTTMPGPAILFVPGWTMPGWIWQKQIDYFSRDYRVVVMDPRSQGESTQTADGLYPAVMARDIKAVIDHLHLAPVLIVSWSMAVMETLAYVDQFGTGDFAGIVLVDYGPGGDPDAGQNFGLLKGVLEDRQKTTDTFIRKISFQKPQPEEFVQKVIQASLRVPTNTAVTMLVGLFVSDYRAVLPKIDRPTLICAAKNPYMKPITDMQAKIPGSQLEIFEGDGHALFVDDPDKFNAALEDFLHDLK